MIGIYIGSQPTGSKVNGRQNVEVMHSEATSTVLEREHECRQETCFPECCVTLMPDIAVWFHGAKKHITIEVTVPWKSIRKEAYEKKKAKNSWSKAGWYTLLFSIKVGLRGFCSQSVCRLMAAVEY